ncbi:putative ABC transporter permease YknZ [bacterium HR16]|nr:putative ABC transporter permease YknZ [bacterium HR16]
MSLIDSFLTALANLRRHKLRSLLTMLGVIIGVAAVILMVSLVEGARSRVVEEFRQLGSSLIIIAYDPSLRKRGETPGSIEGLRMEDAQAILQECSNVKMVSAEFNVGNQKIRYGAEEMDAAVDGCQPEYLYLHNLQVERGRFITQEDLDNWSKVCVLGKEVQKRLFGNRDPVGEIVEIAGVSATVVGVLSPKGRTFGEDWDKRVLVPITSLQKRFVGIDLVSVIFAQPREPERTTETMDEIWQLLMRRHDNQPYFRVDSQERLLSSIGRVLSIFGLVVGAIAGLSLLVGGIGIMNIMLVTVAERTREIGIRKAVGARNRDILLQFLIESMTLSGVGGIIGILLGCGTSLLIGWGTRQAKLFGGEGLTTHLPLWAATAGFLFSAAVGIFFGMYPAWRASRLNPIEALRYE